ncbi:hypothetical protein [Spiroplasma sp. DGKH1]|uniref:hypothetical protein n=1 Tax=Spiroplasma sp. DGKH1 TaxID=3050074 RepID=UPI0034C6585D
MANGLVNFNLYALLFLLLVKIILISYIFGYFRLLFLTISKKRHGTIISQGFYYRPFVFHLLHFIILLVLYLLFNYLAYYDTILIFNLEINIQAFFTISVLYTTMVYWFVQNHKDRYLLLFCFILFIIINFIYKLIIYFVLQLPASFMRDGMFLGMIYLIIGWLVLFNFNNKIKLYFQVSLLKLIMWLISYQPQGHYLVIRHKIQLIFLTDGIQILFQILFDINSLKYEMLLEQHHQEFLQRWKITEDSIWLLIYVLMLLNNDSCLKKESPITTDNPLKLKWLYKKGWFQVMLN